VRSENSSWWKQTKGDSIGRGNLRDLIWHAQIVSADTPWVSIVIPDEDAVGAQGTVWHAASK